VITQNPPSPLRVEQLSKHYGKTLALNELSFFLDAGTFNVLLGPNGAGKSTLFQVLTGLFSADSGDVFLANNSLRNQATSALKSLGVVFQSQSLDLDLSIERNWKFQAALQGMSKTNTQLRVSELATLFGFTDNLKQAVRELSGGNRRKVELARALLHQPSILLMDEASVGLDLKSRKDLLTIVNQEVATRKMTVLWATHLVDEAQNADRVLILHKGKLVADGSGTHISTTQDCADLESAFLKLTQVKGIA
jgi:ABC-2 type transport system ATP-binding protein